ncbi:MAG: hypothetical protein NUW23_05225 [Firmicutes bacterium]|jgi:hypothetical protein|nr:hypothetical protein [Bacillota bacterium]
MHRRNLIVFLFVALAVAGLATASVASAAEPDSNRPYTGHLLLAQPGARAAAMGGVFCALDDPSAVGLWNPACLAYVTEQNVACVVSSRFESDFVLGAGYTRPGLGLAIFSAGAWDIEAVDEFGNPTGAFLSTGETALVGAGALRLGPASVGASVIGYWNQLADATGQGFTADLGVVYAAGPVRLGAVAKAVVGRISYEDDTVDGFDPYVAFGASADIVENFTLAADFEASGRLKVGGELRLRKVAVRAGSAVRAGQVEMVTAGAGFGIGPVHIDYAVQTHSALASQHSVCASVRF